MKNLLLPPFAALVLFGGIGCEMHPPSRTVKVDKKDLAEEKAAQKEAFSPQPANPNPPTFFKNN